MNNFVLQTPYYLIKETLLRKNLNILKNIIDKTNCKILLAQKAFSNYKLYPIISEYLNGTCSSGLFETKLAKEYFNGEIHVFSPAYIDNEIEEIASISDYVVFNSVTQLIKFKNIILKKNKKIGIRINPEISTVKNKMYDPCSEKSRLGITLNNLNENIEIMKYISGIHFHTLCEQNVEDLQITLDKIEKNFSFILKKITWINFGGGHHITNKTYNFNKLIKIINDFKNKYNIQVYLEPGEAVVLNAGFLHTKVIDIIKNNQQLIAIIDTSASCHMPDILEVPYTPNIINGYPNGIKKFNYLLGGPTCLAGDIIGEYSFNEPLYLNQELIFTDMAHYTMVKNNTFNGINLPSIIFEQSNGSKKLLKKFDYLDFKNKI